MNKYNVNRVFLGTDELVSDVIRHEIIICKLIHEFIKFIVAYLLLIKSNLVKCCKKFYIPYKQRCIISKIHSVKSYPIAKIHPLRI
ncbi:MAG: hypothetical protein RDU14_02505 [Melioribacteraceae bacterium]|nr:hypothetical protein [Melioribacteraceae bacterium]